MTEVAMEVAEGSEATGTTRSEVAGEVADVGADAEIFDRRLDARQLYRIERLEETGPAERNGCQFSRWRVACQLDHRTPDGTHPYQQRVFTFFAYCAYYRSCTQLLFAKVCVANSAFRFTETSRYSDHMINIACGVNTPYHPRDRHVSNQASKHCCSMRSMHCLHETKV
jgi:hypothetical protein